ncbi:MAG: hypothetical protein AAF478_12395 [Pseudomonadota bacterium]
MKKTTFTLMAAAIVSFAAAPAFGAGATNKPSQNAQIENNIVLVGVKTKHTHRHCHHRVRHGKLVKYCHTHRHRKLTHHL